jgi:multidrug transporter EmrE-like cation transporter
LVAHSALYYVYIFGTILFTVYGQIVLKWQVAQAGGLPADASRKLNFILRMLLNPWVISSLAGAFLASLCWMAAMTRSRLSYAYPFTSLGFALVMLSSALFLGETLTWPKVLGVVVIMVGIAIGCQG